MAPVSGTTNAAGGSAGVITTDSPAPTEDRWGRALRKVKDKDLASDFDATSKRELLLEVLSMVRDAEKTCQQKRWKWKNRKGETVILRDVFVKMAVWIEKFKAVGDSIVQYDPGHAALPWAAARFILQAALNDIQTNSAMLEGLELVFHLITKFEVIEHLYLRRVSALHQQLDDSIVALYGAILEYLFDARHYFSQRTTVRIAKSVFQVEGTKYVSDILAKSSKVDEYIQLISGEIADQTGSLVAQVANKMQVLTLHTQKLNNLDASMDDIHGLIEKERELLESTLNDLNEPIKRMCSQISHIEDKLKEEQRLQIFEWLSSIEYSSHHRTKSKLLLPDSGQWLFRRSEFREWMGSSTSSILWLHGIPGSGKSMLVAHVIEYIKNRNARELSPAPLAYFYCSRNANEPERADPVELVRCILEQLSCSDQDLPIRLPVVDAYQLRRREARGRHPGKLDFEDTVKLILDLLSSNPAIIVIDALDECDPARRQELLNSLQIIIKESNNVVKILVSSRDDHDLVHRLSRSANLYIDSSQNMEDIRKFVTSRVREAIQKEKILCGQVPSKLRDEIIATLIEKAKGMFRLVSLHIESLCDPTRVKTKANVLQVLANLPPDLEKSYDYILAQIASSQKPNPEIASRVFKWLLAAREQVSSQTFILAVCAGMGEVGLISQSNILSICSNLVVYDEDTDNFRFAHLSVVEYLERLDEYSPKAANAFCAEQCLSWIVNREENLFSSSDFNVLIEGTQPIATQNVKRHALKSKHRRSPELANVLYINAIQSFGIHADQEWPSYARIAGEKRREGRLQTLLHRFLLFEGINDTGEASGNEDFALWMDRIPDGPRDGSQKSSYDYDFIRNWQKTPLFACCAFDLVEIVEALLARIPDSLNAHTDWGYNCLIIAADCNSVATIDMLIIESKRQKMSTFDWHRPLWGAVCNVHAQVVQSILAYVGRGFFLPSYFRDFISTPFAAKTVHQQDYEDTILLLLNHSSELQLTEEILLDLFSNKFHSGASMSQALLRSGKSIKITRLLVNSSFINRYCGREMMDTLLAGDKTTTITQEAFVDLYRSAERAHFPSTDRTRMFLLKRRKEYKTLAPYIKQLQNAPFTRCIQLGVIADTASGKLIDLREGLSRILLDQASDEVELTWEHLLLLERGTKRASACVRSVLSAMPKMSQTAINMLLSTWSVELVEELLKFRRVKVTNEVIRIVAWNVTHGEQIMRLLLQREFEEMYL